MCVCLCVSVYAGRGGYYTTDKAKDRDVTLDLIILENPEESSGHEAKLPLTGI